MGSDGKTEQMENSECLLNSRPSVSDMTSDSEGRISTATEDEEEQQSFRLGPKRSIKDHLERDKDDESLRRWKEQLLGSVDANSIREHEEADVKILSLTILSPERPDLVLPIPDDGNPKGLWFTLKEGSRYRLRFSIKVSNDIVCGLKYTNTVWKTGIKVDSSKEMLGTFSPQAEPYSHELSAEEKTPLGIFARGTYAARTKFVDDDNKCHLEMSYNFDIQRDWPSK